MSAAFESNVQSITLEASADLSADQYKLMKLSASGQLVRATVKGEAVVGVLGDDPSAAGRAGLLQYGGISKVECGGTFNPGVKLCTDGNGLAIAATLVTDNVFGTSLEAGANGAQASAIIDPQGAWVA